MAILVAKLNFDCAHILTCSESYVAARSSFHVLGQQSEDCPRASGMLGQMLTSWLQNAMISFFLLKFFVSSFWISLGGPKKAKGRSA